jgi:thiosulfate dehydrogenase
LNGLHLKEEDKEMKAMIAYIEYIGKDVPKGRRSQGLWDL